MTDTEPSATTEGEPPPMPAGLADEQFATNIREERERQGLSQADVAERMRKRGWSWHPQTVQKIESGNRKVTVGEGKALAEVVGSTVDRLTWPGREASAAALLEQVTGRAESAWEQIASWTATLLWAQFQLGTTVAEAERADYLGSSRIAEKAEIAHKALEMTPEAAVETGREDHARMRQEGVSDEDEPLMHMEEGESDVAH